MYEIVWKHDVHIFSDLGHLGNLEILMLLLPFSIYMDIAWPTQRTRATISLGVVPKVSLLEEKKEVEVGILSNLIQNSYFTLFWL